MSNQTAVFFTELKEDGIISKSTYTIHKAVHVPKLDRITVYYSGIIPVVDRKDLTDNIKDYYRSVNLVLFKHV